MSDTQSVMREGEGEIGKEEGKEGEKEGEKSEGRSNWLCPSFLSRGGGVNNSLYILRINHYSTYHYINSLLC